MVLREGGRPTIAQSDGGCWKPAERESNQRWERVHEPLPQSSLNQTLPHFTWRMHTYIFQVSIRNKQTHMLARPTVFFSSFPTWGCLSPQGPRVSQSTRFSFTGGWSWKVMRGKVELILYWMTLISFQPQNNSVRTTIISLCTTEGAVARKG